MPQQNVMVLFADVVDSTALSHSLTPDDADQVRQSVFGAMRQSVAASGGREVKSLGDGLMVAFSSATQALDCAVLMQQGVERLSRRRSETIEIRVGISGGEVTVEDDDYFGDAVVEAARLCAVCAPAKIVASRIVQLTAGRRSEHSWRDLGGLSLKGIPHLVEAAEVQWEPSATDEIVRIPLPERLSYAPEAGLVGRRDGLNEISSALARVGVTTGCEVIFVAGEAGLGKTSLLCEAAREAFDDGATVLFGHTEEDVRAPYQLFAESLSHLITHAPEKDLTEHVERNGPVLAVIAPVLSSRIRPDANKVAVEGAGDAERFVLFAAVVDLLTRSSAARKIVLVLDDLQWADSASLSLLRHLVASDQLSKVLVLGSYRDNELANSPELIETVAALRRSERFARIDLTGLGAEEVVSLMEGLAAHDLSDDEIALAHSIARETDGNPFFAQEVIRHVRDTRSDAGGASDLIANDLPDSVRDVVGARVRRLGEDAHRVLSTAAVIGRDFDFALLRAASELDADVLLESLELAEAHSLVRESRTAGNYSFAHALFQHTLYQEIGSTRRALTHRKIAVALETLVKNQVDQRVGELARHWSLTGDAADARTAYGYLRQAAESALSSLAPSEALRYYAQVLELTNGPVALSAIERLDITIGYGSALQQAADQSYRSILLDAAHQAIALQDAERLTAAVLANDRGFMGQVGILDTPKVEVLEEAIRRVEGGPSRALMLAKLCGELTYHYDHFYRDALADEAFDIARECVDPLIFTKVSSHVYYATMIPHTVTRSLERTEESLRRAENADLLTLVKALVDRMVDLGRIGDLEGVDALLDRIRPLVARLGLPTVRWAVALNECWRALFRGDTAAAEALANLGLTHGMEAGEPDAVTFYGVQIMMIERQRGNLDAVISFIQQSIDEHPELTGLNCMLALAYVDTDHFDEAQVILDAFAQDDYQHPVGVDWLNSVACYAEVAYQCRDLAAAANLRAQLAPFSDLIITLGGTDVGGLVAHHLGQLCAVLGDFDDAERHFAHAAALGKKLEMSFFLSWTEVSWARFRLQRGAPGDLDFARTALHDSAERAKSGGYANLQRRALAQLERIG